MYNHLLWPILELVRQVWSSRDPNFRTAFTFPQVLKRPMPGGRFLSMQGWSAWIESGYVGGWAEVGACWPDGEESVGSALVEVLVELPLLTAQSHCKYWDPGLPLLS
jgi:hypothetical protein